MRHPSRMGIGEIFLNVLVAAAILAGLIWALKKTGHDKSEHEK